MNNLEFLHCYLHFAGETNIRISFFVYKFTNCLKKRKKKGGKVDSITTTLTRCKRLNLKSFKKLSNERFRIFISLFRRK